MDGYKKGHLYFASESVGEGHPVRQKRQDRLHLSIPGILSKKKTKKQKKTFFLFIFHYLLITLL